MGITKGIFSNYSKSCIQVKWKKKKEFIELLHTTKEQLDEDQGQD
jgi:hypothetical protein